MLHNGNAICADRSIGRKLFDCNGLQLRNGLIHIRQGVQVVSFHNGSIFAIIGKPLSRRYTMGGKSDFGTSREA